MVESLAMAWEVIFPILFLLGLGMFCRNCKLIQKRTVEDVNRLVFYLFLPCMSFLNIYTTEKEAFITRDNMVLLAICVAVTVGSAAMVEWSLRMRRYPTHTRAVLTQGVYQTNGMIFALPIVTSICGSQQLAPFSLMILVLSPLYMVLSVFVLSSVQQMQRNWKEVGLEIIKTPILLASLAAFILMLTGVKLPELMIETIQKVANVTTPISFIMLGASLQLCGFANDWKKLAGIGIARLLVIPGICLVLGLLFGLQGVHIITIVCLMGSPIAVSSFALTQKYGANTALAAELITFTTIAAGGTMIFWITLLNLAGVV